MKWNNNSIQWSTAQKTVHTVWFSAWETQAVVNITQVLAFGRVPKQYLSYFACRARKLCKVECLSVLSLQCSKALLMLHVLYYIAQVKLRLQVTFSIGTLSQKRFDGHKVTFFFFFFCQYFAQTGNQCSSRSNPSLSSFAKPYHPIVLIGTVSANWRVEISFSILNVKRFAIYTEWKILLPYQR